MKKEKLNSETNKAVEWFAKQVLRSRQLGFISNEKFNELLEQAKEMDKEQSFEIFKAGQESMEEGGRGFDQYYNENFRIR